MKAQFLDVLRTERAAWESLLQGVGEARMTIPGAVGDWSVKDVIAHILSYEQYIRDRLQETSTGVVYEPSATSEALNAYALSPGYPDFGSPLLDDDVPNAWVVQHYRERSLDDVLVLEEQAFADIIRAINGLSSVQLAAPGWYERIASNTYEHYRHHAADIRRWLDISSGVGHL